MTVEIRNQLNQISELQSRVDALNQEKISIQNQMPTLVAQSISDQVKYNRNLSISLNEMKNNTFSKFSIYIISSLVILVALSFLGVWYYNKTNFY